MASGSMPVSASVPARPLMMAPIDGCDVHPAATSHDDLTHTMPWHATAHADGKAGVVCLGTPEPGTTLQGGHCAAHLTLSQWRSPQCLPPPWRMPAAWPPPCQLCRACAHGSAHPGAVFCSKHAEQSSRRISSHINANGPGHQWPFTMSQATQHSRKEYIHTSTPGSGLWRHVVSTNQPAVAGEKTAVDIGSCKLVPDNHHTMHFHDSLQAGYD